jgi:hypothetical protein
MVWAGSPVTALAGPARERPAPPAADTPEHHLALAADYRARAEAYRQDAEAYARALDAFRRRDMPPNKTGAERPWVKAKRVETERLIQTAERQARYFDRFAEYHEFRAKELGGE